MTLILWRAVQSASRKATKTIGKVGSFDQATRNGAAKRPAAKSATNNKGVKSDRRRRDQTGINFATSALGWVQKNGPMRRVRAGGLAHRMFAVFTGGRTARCAFCFCATRNQPPAASAAASAAGVTDTTCSTP